MQREKYFWHKTAVCTISVIHSQIKEPEKVIALLSEKLKIDEQNCTEKSRKNFFHRKKDKCGEKVQVMR